MGRRCAQTRLSAGHSHVDCSRLYTKPLKVYPVGLENARRRCALVYGIGECGRAARADYRSLTSEMLHCHIEKCHENEIISRDA